MSYNYNPDAHRKDACSHCGQSHYRGDLAGHERDCCSNPKNRHEVVVFYGDHTVYWEGEVFGPKELDALNVKTPAGGYVKLAKDCKSK